MIEYPYENINLKVYENPVLKGIIKNIDNYYQRNVETCKNKEKMLLDIITEDKTLKQIIYLFDRYNNGYQEQSILATLATTYNIAEDGLVESVNKGLNIHHFDIFCYLIHIFIWRLTHKYNINIEYLDNITKDSIIIKSYKNEIDKDNYIYLLKIIFKHFLNNEVVEVVFMSIPIIEQLLRQLCKLNDIQHINTDKNGVEKVDNLSTILKKLKSKNILSDIFIEWVEIILLNSNQRGGFNYRNKISHGRLINMRPLEASLLVYIILKLLTWNKAIE